MTSTKGHVHLNDLGLDARLYYLFGTGSVDIDLSERKMHVSRMWGMNRARNMEIRILLSTLLLSRPITSGQSLQWTPKKEFTTHLQTGRWNEVTYNTSQNKTQTPCYGPQVGLRCLSSAYISNFITCHAPAHSPRSSCIETISGPLTGCTSFLLHGLCTCSSLCHGHSALSTQLAPSQPFVL